MEWLWIAAVALVVVFVLVLCWLFFNDYTCCPCEKRRPPNRDVETNATPFTTIDRDSFRYRPWTEPEQSHGGYRLPYTVTIDSVPQPRVKPQAPLPPPRPTRLPTPHLQPLITYNLGSDLEGRGVVRMERGVPTLDLHQMRVREAVNVTRNFLQQSRGHYRKVRIITGRGLHSVDGVPRIKPAVEDLLSGRNYRETAKGGCFEVTL